MGEQCRRWFVIASLALLGILCISPITFADFPVMRVSLPAEWSLETQKVIFSGDGGTMAVLLMEPKQDVKKAQAIALFDLKTKKWTKVTELAGGILWEIEPLALNVDGRYLAYRYRDRLVIYDTVKRTVLREIPDAGSMTQAAFAYGSRYLAFLQNAEWEVPTSIGVYDLYETNSDAAVKTLVKYSKKTKAAGPLQWDTTGALYFVEEYTYGSVNPEGVLKLFAPSKKKSYEQYNTKSKTTRVSTYAVSIDRQYTVMVLRELSADQSSSSYGLLIQKNGEFLHAVQLQNWVDAIENGTSGEIGSVGWVGNSTAYWIERTKAGSDLNLFQVDEKKVSTYHYDQQVYLAPNGVILIMER